MIATDYRTLLPTYVPPYVITTERGDARYAMMYGDVNKVFSTSRLQFGNSTLGTSFDNAGFALETVTGQTQQRFRAMNMTDSNNPYYGNGILLETTTNNWTAKERTLEVTREKFSYRGNLVYHVGNKPTWEALGYTSYLKKSGTDFIVGTATANLVTASSNRGILPNAANGGFIGATNRRFGVGAFVNTNTTTLTVGGDATVDGDITFNHDSALQWSRNSDGCKIYFRNTGDADADSSMTFQTNDNGNEYFRWETRMSGETDASAVVWMTLKAGELRVNNHLVFHDGRLPTKTNVGLSLVNNWGATSATNDASNTKYATAGAVKKAYDLAASKMTMAQGDVRYLRVSGQGGSGAILDGDITISKHTPRLKLNNTSFAAGNACIEFLTDATQNAILEHVIVDADVVGGIGQMLKLRSLSGVETPVQLSVEGEIYAANNQKVYHPGNNPNKAAVGLSAVNNWGASSVTNSSSTTTYATTAGVKSAYDLAASKITKAQGDSYYLGKNATSDTSKRLLSSGRASFISGTTTFDSGITLVEAYSTITPGYPATFGNIIRLGGSASTGRGEIFVEWSGTDAANGRMFFRNKRDVGSAAWSSYSMIYDQHNKPTPTELGIYSKTESDARHVRYGTGSYSQILGKNGSTSDWLRTTTNGLLPSANGAGSLGTSSWKFAQAHAIAFYENGTSIVDKYLGKTATATNSLKLNGIDASGYSRFYSYGIGSSVDGRKWYRLADIGKTDSGLSLTLTLLGDFGNKQKGTMFLTASSRSNVLNINASTLDAVGTSDMPEIGYKVVGERFEIWIKVSDYNLNQGVTVTGNHNATMRMDSPTTTAVTGLTMITAANIYTTGYKPNKTDVGLSAVNNWGATSAVNSSSTTTYATASAVKTAYDKAQEALEHAQAAGDSYTLLAADNRSVKPNNSGTHNISAAKIFFVYNSNFTGTKPAGTYSDMLMLDTYVDSTGGCVNAIIASKTVGGGIWHVQGDWNGTAWKTPERIYTTGNKPNKTDVGLSAVNNWGATTAVNSASTVLYSTASAVKQAYDLAASKITKSQGDSYYLGKGNWSISGQDLVVHGKRAVVGMADGKLYLGYGGDFNTLYFGSNLVYHAGRKPSKTDVGLSAVNNWGATTAVNSTSTTTYATASAVKQAYDLAASKMTQATADGRYALKAGSREQGFNASRIDFKSWADDNASIYTEVGNNITHLTFKVGDDPNGNDSFKWKFNDVLVAQLYGTSTTAANTGRLNIFGEIYAGAGNQRVYHTGYKPNKTDVGLSAVNNWGATTSVSSTSTTTYATASAVKSAYDRGTAGINAANGKLATAGGTVTGSITANHNAQIIKFSDTNKYVFATGGDYNWGLYWDTTPNIYSFRGAGAAKFDINVENGNSAQVGSNQATSFRSGNNTDGCEMKYNASTKSLDFIFY